MTDTRSYPGTDGLLPCPFCGVTPLERFEKNINGAKYPNHWFVWCENLDCRAGGESMEETQEAARVAWNTRAPQCDAAAQGWQDISTAPKDGTRILLFKAGRGAFEGWWHTAWPHPEAYWMDDADSEPEPTHWRPTLALPSTKRETDQPYDVWAPSEDAMNRKNNG